MGAWGPAIFSDDTACDIRDDYRELLEDGATDTDAMRQVIDSYRHLDEDHAHVIWLALAAAQVGIGRLDDEVQTKALAIIDGDIGLTLWEEAGANELAKRRAALAKLRDALVGPQRPAKKVRRAWAHVTDLAPGDVLSYRLPDDRYALFKVARVDEHRVGTAPILRRLDWNKTTLPSAWRLGRLRYLPETKPMSGQQSVSYRVAKHRKKDEDWRDVGFALLGAVKPSRDDARHDPRTLTAWRGLSRSLDNGWDA